MPYITKSNRQIIKSELDVLAEKIKTSFSEEEYGGVLNYSIAVLLMRVFMPKTADWRYKNLSKIIGTLECCKQELYRIVGSGIENNAINKNGNLAEFYNGCIDDDDEEILKDYLP